jgi:hypothetical protein
MRKVEDNGVRIIYRRGARSAWWLVFAMPVGMAILFLLGDREPMHYLVFAFAGAVMFIPAAFNEHFVIDTHIRAMIQSETFLGRTTRSETIPFSQATSVTVVPNYARDGRKRSVRPDGFALEVDWTTSSGEGNIRLDNFWDKDQATAEAVKLGRLLGTHVEDAKA